MNVKTRNRALVGVGAATALALVFAPATAAMAAPLSNGSEFPVYLLDTDSEAPIPNDTVLAWEGFATLAADEAVPYTRFPASPDATGVKYFISAPGQEYTQAQWYGTKIGAINAEFTNGLSYVPLDTFGDGDRAGDVSEVKTNGGTYSLGFVYTKENGNIIANGKGAWVTIQVTAGTGAWTFTEPSVVPVNTAPVVTTQPANDTVAVGENASFTAAATGTPAPTVKWQSKVGAGAWADVSGATTATLTVTAPTLAQSGTQYRAVFTNGVAPDATTNPATLTVNPPAPTAPEEPTAGDANNVVIPPLVEGETEITIPAGIANAGKNLTAWAWSDPTPLGNVTAAPNGDVVVDTASLPAGEHTIGLTEQGDATFAIVAWGTVDIAANPGEDIAENVDLEATVTAEDLWALEGVPGSVDFGTVARNTSKTATLGQLKVIDDRLELKGWTLTAAWAPFVGATDQLPASVMTVASEDVDTAPLPAGVTVGTGPLIGESTAVSTLATGALFDVDLTFNAPRDANAERYTSTLTVTLASK